MLCFALRVQVGISFDCLLTVIYLRLLRTWKSSVILGRFVNSNWQSGPFFRQQFCNSRISLCVHWPEEYDRVANKKCIECWKTCLNDHFSSHWMTFSHSSMIQKKTQWESKGADLIKVNIYVATFQNLSRISLRIFFYEFVAFGRIVVFDSNTHPKFENSLKILTTLSNFWC